MGVQEGIKPIIDAIEGKYSSGDIVFYRKNEIEIRKVRFLSKFFKHESLLVEYITFVIYVSKISEHPMLIYRFL